MNYKYKVKIENQQQLDIVLKSENVDEIIIARDCFAENKLPKLVNKIKDSKKKAWIMLERISRYEEFKNQELRITTDKIFDIPNLDGIIIQNLDSFSYMLRKANKFNNENLKVELNYTMNCYNLKSKELFISLYNEKRDNHDKVPLLITAPLELNIYELYDVGYDTFIVYSYIDTMVSANCLRKNTSKDSVCEKRFAYDDVDSFSSCIIDRKNMKLHYKTYCKYCYNKIFNTEPLYLIDKLDAIDISRVIDKSKQDEKNCSIRIDFSFESEKEVKSILENKMPKSFTRGHIKNSIK